MKLLTKTIFEILSDFANNKLSDQNSIKIKFPSEIPIGFNRLVIEFQIDLQYVHSEATRIELEFINIPFEQRINQKLEKLKKDTNERMKHFETVYEAAITELTYDQNVIDVKLDKLE